MDKSSGQKDVIVQVIRQHDSEHGTFLERHGCVAIALVVIGIVGFLVTLWSLPLLVFYQTETQWQSIVFGISLVVWVPIAGVYCFFASWTEPSSFATDALLHSIASESKISTEFKACVGQSLTLSPTGTLTRGQLYALIDNEQARIEAQARKMQPGFQALTSGRSTSD